MPVHASNCRGQSDKGVPTAFCRAGTQTMAFFFFFLSQQLTSAEGKKDEGTVDGGRVGGVGGDFFKKKKRSRLQGECVDMTQRRV